MIDSDATQGPEHAPTLLPLQSNSELNVISWAKEKDHYLFSFKVTDSLLGLAHGLYFKSDLPFCYQLEKTLLLKVHVIRLVQLIYYW